MNERIYSEIRSFLFLSLVSFLSHNYQMCLLWNFLVKFQMSTINPVQVKNVLSSSADFLNILMLCMR